MDRQSTAVGVIPHQHEHNPSGLGVVQALPFVLTSTYCETVFNITNWNLQCCEKVSDPFLIPPLFVTLTCFWKLWFNFTWQPGLITARPVESINHLDETEPVRQSVVCRLKDLKTQHSVLPSKETKEQMRNKGGKVLPSPLKATVSVIIHRLRKPATVVNLEWLAYKNHSICNSSRRPQKSPEHHLKNCGHHLPQSEMLWHDLK